MRASAGRVIKVFRILTRGPAVAGLICLCFADCLWHACLQKLDSASGAAILHRWCRRILARLRVQVTLIGTVPAEGLIASNHLSYLEILVFSAVSPCLFVSKSEVKSWPVIGWIARMTGTVFVDRRPGKVHTPQQQMQEELGAGRCVILFPEGTSTDSREILPFRSSFFEAAVAASAPITAARVAYDLPERDGDPVTDICYWGEMTLLPHFFKLLTKARVKATIRFSDHPRIFRDRKQAAREMQQEVADLANEVACPREMAVSTQ